MRSQELLLEGRSGLLIQKISAVQLLTNKDFPKITDGDVTLEIIAFPSTRLYHPVIMACNESGVIIQSLYDVAMSPFAYPVSSILFPPIVAVFGQQRVVIIHSYERATGIGHRISQIAKVPNHSLTTAVSRRDHVKSTPSILLSAVEPQLSERQDGLELFHGSFTKTHLTVIVIVLNSAV